MHTEGEQGNTMNTNDKLITYWTERMYHSMHILRDAKWQLTLPGNTPHQIAQYEEDLVYCKADVLECMANIRRLRDEATTA